MWSKLSVILGLFIVSVANAIPLNEGFETDSIPDSWTIINNDNDSYKWGAIQGTWYAHSGQWAALVYTYGTTQTNDDWLITPKLDVDSGDVFRVWAKSYTGSWFEDFNIRVSTTTPQIPSFTDTLNTFKNIPITYQQYSCSLDAYAGQAIYIAIQCVSDSGYFFMVDDITGPDIWVPDSEVGVDTICKPDNGAFIVGDSLQSIKIDITNFGKLTQSDIPVILDITGSSGYTYADTELTDSIKQDETQQITFDWLTPDVIVKSCTVKVWTELPNDEDPYNDTGVVRVTVYKKGYYWEGFETDSIPDTWTVINNNSNIYKWMAAKASQFAHTGNWLATVHYGTSPNDDWLITPRLAVDSADVIYFWAKSRFSAYPEAFNLLVSGTTPAINSFTDTLAKVTSVPSVYTEYLYSLDAYEDDSIYIAVQCISTNGLYLDVDDFLSPKPLPPGAEATVKVPNSFAIMQSSPNPMRTKTTIFYQLPEEAKVSIKVYNCAGLFVKTLIDESLKPGYYSVTWNGLDDNGKVLPSGLYFYKMDSTMFSQTNKLILIR